MSRAHDLAEHARTLSTSLSAIVGGGVTRNPASIEGAFARMEEAATLLVLLAAHVEPTVDTGSLTTPATFAENDRVLVARRFRDCSRIKWVERMDEMLGTIGEVAEVDCDGDIRLSGGSWWYAPEALDRVAA